MPTLAEIRAEFRFDKDAQRWRGASGRFVSERALKRALTRFADNAGAEIRGLARQLNDGEINLAEWQEATALRVKNIHLAMHAAGRGGFHNLTQADYGRLGARLRRQYGYLQRFALDIEAGRQSPAQIEYRAGLYAAGGNGVYENARRDGANEVYAEERRVLGAAEHCDVCIEEAAKGWVEAGTLRQIGDSPCRANCMCRFRFRNP